MIPGEDEHELRDFTISPSSSASSPTTWLTKAFYIFLKRLVLPSSSSPSSKMVTPLNHAYRAVSTENLLAPPEEAFAPFLQRPRIVMGDSADSNDSLLGPPGQYLNLTHELPGGTRSVPDIEMHARDTRHENSGHRGQRHLMSHVRCSCSHLPRASSKESVRSFQNNEILVVAPSSYR